MDKPRLWQPPSLAARTLRALNVRRNAIKSNLEREYNRLKKLEATDMIGLVKKSTRKSIDFLEKQQCPIVADIAKHIEGTPALLSNYKLLQTILGVGERVGHA